MVVEVVRSVHCR